MKTLEIELGEGLESKKDALKNFVGRVVVVQHDKYGKIKGKVESLEEDQFNIRKPASDKLAAIYAKVYTLSYEKITELAIANPTQADYIDEDRRNILKSNPSFGSQY